MARILLIGIDGLSLELVRQWADDGYLPHLREMLAAGNSGPLCSTPEFSSPQDQNFAHVHLPCYQ